MGITLQTGFNVQSGPIDDRFVVANKTARYNLNSLVVYEGLTAYQTDTDQLFVLKDVTNKGNDNGWIEITNQNSFPFDGNAVISGSLEFFNHPISTSIIPLIFHPSESNLKIQKDDGTLFDSLPGKDIPNSSTYNNTESIFSNSTSTVRFHSSSNIVINFNSPQKLTEIHHLFAETNNLEGVPNSRIPNSIEIYGSNEQDFTINPGVLLSEGATISDNIDPLKISHFNPLENNISNLERTSSIPLFRQERFQYYRIRYSGSFNEGIISNINYTSINHIGYNVDQSLPQPSTLINNNIISSSKVLITSGTFDILQAGNILDVSKSIATNKASIQDINAEGADFENIAKNVLPDAGTLTNGVSNKTIGASDKKWNQIYVQDTFFGGIHEINLETEGLDKMQEGTVLSLQNGILHPCEFEEDPLVMGVVSKESNYPIILGAEPILITGPIKEGDYIVTSNIKGHGKGINPKHIYSKQLFGKIIAQSIENGKGKSYTIKAMIRKM